MKTRKIVNKKIRIVKPGLNVAADIQAVVATNVDEPGTATRSTAKTREGKRTRIDGGRRKDRRGRG
jgi:hypothetical protein